MLSFYSLLSGGSGEGGADFFYLGSSDRMNKGWFKAVAGRVQTGYIRNHPFTEGIVKHWKRFPREVVDAPIQSNV